MLLNNDVNVARTKILQQATTKTTAIYYKLNAALTAVIGLGLTIEVGGAWVSGNTKFHKELLKEAGTSEHPKKFRWYSHPEEYRSEKHKPWSMDAIYSK